MKKKLNSINIRSRRIKAKSKLILIKIWRVLHNC